MTLNLTVNESEPPACVPAPPPAAQGQWRAVARFLGRPGTQPFGPFATRDKAEGCAVVLAGRADVEAVAVEPVTP